MSRGESSYRPMMTQYRAEKLRQWHEDAYRSMRARGEERVSFIGSELVVPAEVFAPTPMSDLLGHAVLDEVRSTDRVLDMGTGCGVNAILAASCSCDVIGVDTNPHAIAAAIENARRNGVHERATFRESDLFSAVSGTFDLIVFDPPFRWFRPRDLLETSIADEGYRTLARFMREARRYLSSPGRILLFFGTSGDFDYLRSLIERERFASTAVATRELARDGLTVLYTVLRLTPSTPGCEDPRCDEAP